MQEARGQLEGLVTSQSAQGRALLAEMQEKLAQVCRICLQAGSASDISYIVSVMAPRLTCAHVQTT